MVSKSDIPDDIQSEPRTTQSSDSPPRSRQTRGGPRRATRSTPSSYHIQGHGSKEHYQENISGILQLIGAMAFPVAPADAAAIVMHSNDVSNAVADLAVNDSRIARILDKLLEIGPYGALITAVMPLAAQILANHGIIKGGTPQEPGPFNTLTAEECVGLVIGKPNENKANGHARSSPSDVPA
jgi:hypothetical protein